MGLPPHLRVPKPGASLRWWWALALAFETQLLMMAQPALPTPSSEPQPGARISASPHQGMNGDTNRAATVGAACSLQPALALLEMRGCPAILLFGKASSLPQHLLSTAKNRPSAMEKHRDKPWL